MADVTLDVNVEEVDRLKDSLRNAKARVEFDAPHATSVEFGTPAHTPPYEAIYKWTDDKWARLDSGLKNYVLEQNSTIEENTQEHIEQTAWTVWASIKQNGTKPNYYLTRASQEARIREMEKIAKKYQGSDDPHAPEDFIFEVADWVLVRASEILADEDIYHTGSLYESGHTRKGKDEVPTENVSGPTRVVR